MAFQSPLRLMRLNEVLDLTGLSRATLYRKIAAGTFPPQHKLAERCCGRRAGAAELWLRNPVSFTLADLERHRHAASRPEKPTTRAGTPARVERWEEHTSKL